MAFRAKEATPADAGLRPSNGNGHVSAPGNGSTASTASAANGFKKPDAIPQPVPTQLLPSPNGDAVALQPLFEEIQLLRRQIEHVNAGRANDRTEDKLQDSVTATNALLETLPDRLARALGEALARQHQMIMHGVDLALRDFVARLDYHLAPRLTETGINDSGL